MKMRDFVKTPFNEINKVYPFWINPLEDSV